MKKFLNSVWGIAGLCAVGAALVVWRIVIPIFGTSDDNFAVSFAEDDWMEAEMSIEAVRHTLTAVDAMALNWESSPFRDPFTVHGVIDNADRAVVAQAARPAGVARRPTLDALVAGSQSKFAIINGELVVKGDRVANHTVTDINARGVSLRDDINGIDSVITVHRR